MRKREKKGQLCLISLKAQEFFHINIAFLGKHIKEVNFFKYVIKYNLNTSL